MLIESRNDVKIEVMDNGVLDLCLNHIDKYPEDDIDSQILNLSLTIITSAVRLYQYLKMTNILGYFITNDSIIYR